MKKPSSGVAVGLWMAGALVAIYAAGGVALVIDLRQGLPVFSKFPLPVMEAISFIYKPVLQVVFHIWPELIPFSPARS